MKKSNGASLSKGASGRVIDFETAELRKVPFQDSLYLKVTGQMPVSGFEVKLTPHVYLQQPDYWGIEVTIKSNPAKKSESDSTQKDLSFECSVPLIGITGKCGITVIGASMSKQIEIPIAD